MIKLPEYIIERVGNLWTLYNTVSCECLEFPTRQEAEEKLKQLKK